MVSSRSRRPTGKRRSPGPAPFVPNAAGELINTAGDTLMGYNLQDNTYNAATGTGTLEPINISTQALIANASSNGTLSVNLPSTATAVAAANLPSTNTAGATFTEKASLVAYDNLGTPVNLDIYMTKTGSNTWEASVYNSADAASGGGFPYSAGPLTTQDLTFDPTSGKLATASPTSLSVAIPNGNTMSINLSNTTQLATNYIVSTATADGNAPSKVASITIDKDGTVSSVYASGTISATYKIPLANVESPDNLTVLSGNNYLTNVNSGAATLGIAETGSLGSIDSSSLEGSHGRSRDPADGNDRFAAGLQRQFEGSDDG